MRNKGASSLSRPPGPARPKRTTTASPAAQKSTGQTHGLVDCRPNWWPKAFAARRAGIPYLDGPGVTSSYHRPIGPCRSRHHAGAAMKVRTGVNSGVMEFTFKVTISSVLPLWPVTNPALKIYKHCLTMPSSTSLGGRAEMSEYMARTASTTKCRQEKALFHRFEHAGRTLEAKRLEHLDSGIRSLQHQGLCFWRDDIRGSRLKKVRRAASTKGTSGAQRR